MYQPRAAVRYLKNHRYPVYERKIDDQPWVDPCEGSKLYSQGESDLRYIHTTGDGA